MLKYKVVTEKLDWKGEIVREVRDFEDPAFDIDVGAMLADFVAKGELDFSLAKPEFDLGNLLDAATRATTPNVGFSRYEPGVVMVVSEHIPSISAQFVACSQIGRRRAAESMRWVRTDEDLVEKRSSK